MMPRVSLALFLLFLAWPPVRGQVVYSTVGAGPYGSYDIVGLQKEANMQRAVAFQTYATYTLTSIALPLSVVTPPGKIKVALTANAGDEPGEEIEAFAITNIAATKPALYTVKSVLHPRLEGYVQYWIVVSAASPTQIKWWNTLDSWSSIARPVAQRADGDRWSVIANPYVAGIIVFGKRANGSLTRRVLDDGPW